MDSAHGVSREPCWLCHDVNYDLLFCCLAYALAEVDHMKRTYILFILSVFFLCSCASGRPDQRERHPMPRESVLRWQSSTPF